MSNCDSILIDGSTFSRGAQLRGHPYNATATRVPATGRRTLDWALRRWCADAEECRLCSATCLSHGLGAPRSGKRAHAGGRERILSVWLAARTGRWKRYASCATCHRVARCAEASNLAAANCCTFAKWHRQQQLFRQCAGANGTDCSQTRMIWMGGGESRLVRLWS